MLLAIDAGNTDITFGLHDGRTWSRRWRAPSKENVDPGQWIERFEAEMADAGLAGQAPPQVIISSVVPDITEPLRATFTPLASDPPLLVGPEVYPHLRIKVRNPREMGTDLVANAAAAYERYRDYCVVVDFGTALTFTTIAADGEVLGVAIAPGLRTAVKALFLNAAQLPEVPLEMPTSALGQDTVHAIQAGVVMGYAGMVTHLLMQIKMELGRNCRVIATGGLSEVLASLRGAFDDIDMLLTLEGLAVIARQAGRW
jgi:type III pantothenate kinase